MRLEFDSASFRDPSGFVFYKDGIVYRQINKIFQANYEKFIACGLYNYLVKNNYLIVHKEVNNKFAVNDDSFQVISPETIPFISYPYEWCFSQLKDAALLTLKVQKISLKYDFSLKDASAYNVQFKEGKPIFIDTLSFEKYRVGEPWVAYRQFCQHFLAPLSLMSYVDVRLNQLLKNNIDGIPLELISKLLPFSTKFKFSLAMHIHLHSKSQKKYETITVRKPSTKTISKKGLISIIDNLHSMVEKLQWSPEGTEWHNYYSENINYTDKAILEKEKIVFSMINIIKPKSVWDLGSNDGRFSRIVGRTGAFIVSWDIDPACVELNYKKVITEGENNILPLNIDLTNPSPSIGWNEAERESFISRGPTDAILALGLVHHLTISNNVPLEHISIFLSNLCKYLIIEFIPKSDSQVKKLLVSREDIFTKYDQNNFESVFSNKFKIIKKTKVTESERTVYLMEKL